MKRPNIKRFLALALVVCLAAASCSANAAGEDSGGALPPAGAGRPNIVFVLTDDLSMNLLPYMPRVQKMERQGTTFSHYFVTDSLCCPSRSTTFTGKFPHNTGVFGNKGPDGGYKAFNANGNEPTTFAVALQAAGYRTAMMGKYLNGYAPPRDPVPPGWTEWDVSGNTGYADLDYNLNENGHVVHYGHRPEDYLTDVLSRKGQSFITRSAQAGKPFILELATFTPHRPYTPAPRDAHRFPGLKAPRGPSFNEADISDKPKWNRSHKPLDKQQIAKLDWAFRLRAQDVLGIDKMIGDIQATLKANGVDRDTYIVFSSDNGYHLGEHRLKEGKMTAYDTDIHVPLVVTGPGVAKGRTTGALAQNTDLCPTFEDLAGVKIPGTVDGRSLVPLLAKNAPKRAAASFRQGVLIEHHGPDIEKGDPDLPIPGSGNPKSYEAVRTDHEVYVEYIDGEREYYDLRRDPYELKNTADRLSPRRRSELATLLHRLERCSGKGCR